MKVISIDDLEKVEVEMEGAKNLFKQYRSQGKMVPQCSVFVYLQWNPKGILLIIPIPLNI